MQLASDKIIAEQAYALSNKQIIADAQSMMI
jgi:hypothetical protein